MKNFEQWNGFKGNRWKEKIDVRNFIGMNYTPYDGDASFLEGPTEATNKWICLPVTDIRQATLPKGLTMDQKRWQMI